MSTPESMPCSAIADELTELALGIVGGRRRSEVLSHVASCESCRGELQQLLAVTDAVLELAPEAEPPLGFELRLAERLSPMRASRRRHRSILAVAAALLLLAGLGVGEWTHAPAKATTTSAQLTAKVSGSSHVVGEVAVTSGNPGWVFMTIDYGSWYGKVTCEVTLSSGKVETLGHFTIEGDHGSWGVRVWAGSASVRTAALVSAKGNIVASAYFPT